MGASIDHLSSSSPQQPLVSVVTPSYNQGRFIRATIESVLTQDYPNIEYWVIDGGSTDETVGILREYAHDPRFHWLSEHDKGQSDAVNKGWSRCRGEILGWLNSDDTYMPGAISFQVQSLLSNPHVGLVYGNAVYTNERGQVVGEYPARPFHRARFLHISSIPQPTAFLRRRLFEQCGGLDIELHYALDFELFLRLMWETTFLHTGKLLATYRIHETSKTVSGSDALLAEAIRVVQQVCDQHAKELPGEKDKAVSDWFWCGAINSLDARSYHQALKYTLSAIHTCPLRPRIATFGLKVFDTLFRTRITERVISFLDRRAYRLSLQSNDRRL